MNRGDHVVERFQHLVGKIEITLLQDVALGPRKEPESGLLEFLRGIEFADLGHLFGKARGIQTACLERAFAVVGDAEVLEPQIDRGSGHLDQRIFPVARRRVAVEGAAQVAPLDEIGEFTLFGGNDLPLVLTEFRRDEIEPEGSVELLLVMDDRWLLGPLNITSGRETVFVERPPAIQRAAAEADIVLLAPGEIDQREGILLGFDHTQIALDAILEPHARFRRAMDDHLLDQGMVDEELGNLCRVLRGDQNVEISDRLLAATEAPPLAELSHRLQRTQIREQLLGQHRHHIDPEATGVLAVILDRLEKLCLGLLPESGQLSRLPLLADPLQILHG